MSSWRYALPPLRYISSITTSSVTASTMTRMATRTPGIPRRLVQHCEPVGNKSQLTRCTRSLTSSTSSSQQAHMDEMRRSVDALNVNSEPNTPPPDSLNLLNGGICPDTPLVIDTRKLVSFLRNAGFTQLQSEAITEAMSITSRQTSRHHATHMVTKSEFVGLRSELSILEKSDFALLKTDINGIEKRLETSVAEIYTAVERVENRVIKWVIAVAGAIGLGIGRILMTSSSSSHESKGVPRPPSNVSTDISMPSQRHSPPDLPQTRRNVDSISM